MHAAIFAETGALICKVYKQAIVRNTWLPFAWSIPGKWTLFERETNVFMQLFLQKFELEFARFISKNLGEALEIFCMKYTWRMQIIGKANELLNADFVAEIGALICMVYRQVIGRNTWFSFA